MEPRPPSSARDDERPDLEGLRRMYVRALALEEEGKAQEIAQEMTAGPPLDPDDSAVVLVSEDELAALVTRTFEEEMLPDLLQDFDAEELLENLDALIDQVSDAVAAVVTETVADVTVRAGAELTTPAATQGAS